MQHKISKKNLDLAKTIIQYQNSGLINKPRLFCKEYNIKFSSFRNKIAHLAAYTSLPDALKENFQKAETTYEKKDILIKHGIKPSMIPKVLLGITLIKAIEIIQSNDNNDMHPPVEDMQFIALKPKKPIPKEIDQPILKPQNNLEIIISSGIRVNIEPHVSTDRVIKIIELLKEI